MHNKNSFGGCMPKIIAIDWKGNFLSIGSTQKGTEYISNNDVGLLEKTLKSIIKVHNFFIQLI